MWERTLQDLIRGLRANKKDESKFIAKATDEIRREIKSDDMELKAGAVLKLTYLDMLGYDMSWASFNVVEVMSSPKYHLKVVGYLAAVQSFDQDTEVLMLTTNLLKKDVASNPADVAVALNGISHIVTAELGRDLSPELIRLLTHSRGPIRKRAVIALYKAMQLYPDVFQAGLDRLKEKLDDSDPNVVAATVNVLCEIARANPDSLLSFAPPLFHLLTTSSNNWMLIKIIKLFGHICPHEARLVKKLQPPITDLISTTPAISLLYECVHTCIIGGMLQGYAGDNLARTCVSKLAGFIKDSDQNLKYIALLAMVKIVPSHPHLVAEYQDTIMKSVNDQDVSIRMRALDLVSAMADSANLESIIQQLLSHLATDAPSSTLPTAAESLSQNASSSKSGSAGLVNPSQTSSYRKVLATQILKMGAQDMYANVSNFEWYISVLVDLAHVANVPVGKLIRDQLVDIAGRVRGARRYAVKLMYGLLVDETLLRNASDEDVEGNSCSEVLWAAAWICGEYCSELAEPQRLLAYLLSPAIEALAPEIQAVYVQAALKVFGFWASEVADRWREDSLEDVKDQVVSVLPKLEKFASSNDIEVQERAANALQLFRFVQADLNSYKPPTIESEFDSDTSQPAFPKSLYLIYPLFNAYELNPVAPAAQESVLVPEGLDLDAWIVPPPPDPVLEIAKKVKAKGKERESNGKSGKKDGKSSKGKGKQREDLSRVDTPEVETAEERAERARRKAEREERLRDDPYYIIDKKLPPPSKPPEEDLDAIPIVALEGMPSLSDTVDPERPLLRESNEDRQSALNLFTIERDGEMPVGAKIPITTPIRNPVVRSGASTPSNSARFGAFQEYEVPGENGRSSGAATPEPIKVVKVKKKTKAASGSGKKKTIKPAAEVE